MRRLSTKPEVRVLKIRELVPEPAGYYDATREFLLTLGGPARIDVEKLKRALSEEYDTYCQHEYDCCGRWYTTVWTHTLRRIKSGTWTVRMSYSQNV